LIFVIRVKGWNLIKDLIQTASKSPPVEWFSTLISFDNFWRSVFESSTKSLIFDLVSWSIRFWRKSKICEFQVPIFSDQDVLWFKTE
jgi:hypothetical protein